MLSAEFFQTKGNKICSNITCFCFCGRTLWTLRFSRCMLDALDWGLHVRVRCRFMPVVWVYFFVVVVLKVEGAMLSAEFLHKQRNNSFSTTIFFSFVGGLCGRCACRIACGMVCVGVCMCAADVIASQLCAYIAAWVWMLKIEGAMLSAEFFHNHKNRSFSNAASFFFCGRTLWALRFSHCICNGLDGGLHVCGGCHCTGGVWICLCVVVNVEI